MIAWIYHRNDINSGGFQLWCALRVPKLLRITRFSLYFGVMENFLEENRISFSQSVWRMLKLLLYIIIVAHLLACVWFGIAYFESFSTTILSGSASATEAAVAATGVSWAAKDQLFGENMPTRYLKSLYWAFITITTVGYGDIVPVTIPETIYSVAVMLVGTTLYAMVIANMTSLFSSMDAVPALHRMVERCMHKLMATRAIGGGVNAATSESMNPRGTSGKLQLSQKMKLYYGYKWQAFMGMNESEVWTTIPLALREEIAMYL